MTSRSTPEAGSHGATPPGHATSGVRKFLVVADTSPEARLALHFASRRARATRAQVTLLSVLSPADFQHWMTVGELMREEARQDAESALYELAGEVNRLSGLFPELVIREGSAQEAVSGLIEDDPQIRIMVLGASSHKEGPGPLVTAAVNCAFPVPVTIVPGNLTLSDIEELA